MSGSIEGSGVAMWCDAGAGEAMLYGLTGAASVGGRQAVEAEWKRKEEGS
jgi:hypothetical protein